MAEKHQCARQINAGLLFVYCKKYLNVCFMPVIMLSVSV